MSHRTTFATTIIVSARRWRPGVQGIAGAAAAAGDPAPLLELQTNRRRRDDSSGAE